MITPLMRLSRHECGCIVFAFFGVAKAKFGGKMGRNHTPLHCWQKNAKIIVNNLYIHKNVTNPHLRGTP